MEFILNETVKLFDEIAGLYVDGENDNSRAYDHAENLVNALVDAKILDEQEVSEALGRYCAYQYDTTKHDATYIKGV